MSTLTIAFSPEGPTDVRFLSSVIRRSAEDLLTQHGRKQLDVLEPMPFARPKGNVNGAERLLQVAQQTKGFHCLIIHADADDFSIQAALRERLAPAQVLIAAHPTTAQQQVIPLIPVTMTESWMLADTALLQEALDTDLDIVRELGIPRPSRAETVAHPKSLLLQAIQRLQEIVPPRRRQSDSVLMADLYTQLTDIPLTSLRRLPSFQQFEHDFLTTLITLNLARA